MRSGKYIQQLKGDQKYRAFMPELLPFRLKDDPVLQSLLSKTDLAVGRTALIAGSALSVIGIIYSKAKHWLSAETM